MTDKLTSEELAELMELYRSAQSTPVITFSVGSKDFASIAWEGFEKKWAEIAKRHGASPDEGFNSKTGEIVRQ